MWAFFDFGLLMPALVPAKVLERQDVRKWTNDGEYNLQVRGRLREHLQYFMDTFMEEGTFNPEIQVTPDKDYNFRFYTSVEAYAEGIKQAALAMDYEKFKVTSERFEWNKKYHTILNSIWATVCRLNEPGGFYGPRSAENPRGYTSRTYSGWGDRDDSWYSSRHEQGERRIGDTFGVPEEEWAKYEDSREWIPQYDADGTLVGYQPPPKVVFGDEDYWMADRSEREYVYELANGEVYAIDEETHELIAELDEAGIAMSRWWKFTTPTEFARLTPILESVFSQKVRRAMKKKNLKEHVLKIEEYHNSIETT